MASQKPYLVAEKGREHNTYPWPCVGDDYFLAVITKSGHWLHGIWETEEKEAICHLYFKHTSCVSLGFVQVVLPVFPLLTWGFTMEGIGTPCLSGGNVERCLC